MGDRRWATGEKRKAKRDRLWVIGYGGWVIGDRRKEKSGMRWVIGNR